MKYVVITGEWPSEDTEFDAHQDVFDTLDQAIAHARRHRQAGNTAVIHELRGYRLTEQGARVPDVGARLDV